MDRRNQTKEDGTLCRYQILAFELSRKGKKERLQYASLSDIYLGLVNE